MNRRTFVNLSLLGLAGCAGIPLASLPRLMALQGQLLDVDPADIRLAIQTDAAFAPTAGAVPLLRVQARPARAGAFEPLDLALPMNVAAPAATQGELQPAPAGRQWRVYGLTPDSQARLREVQAAVRDRQRRDGAGGGTVSIGIEQDRLLPGTPGLRDSRWDTWLQTTPREGFFEVWSGTIGQLLARAQR